jgi:hypothetical protein
MLPAEISCCGQTTPHRFNTDTELPCHLPQSLPTGIISVTDSDSDSLGYRRPSNGFAAPGASLLRLGLNHDNTASECFFPMTLKMIFVIRLNNA